ncbi:DNA-directed RNA polymerase subunit E'' [Candidatus Woesearchaeota archaeon]|nr:DNA-directed RNA polymerase subunit E'' [Candidatus Woesearchaeota archaeon]
MVKKKCCKRCKMFVEGSECPVCKDNKFSTNWQGRIYVVDAAKSAIAGKIGIETKGEYALKCR